jgi:hypothetical protein
MLTWFQHHHHRRRHRRDVRRRWVPVLSGSCCLLTLCIALAESIPMAAAQLAVRLPCQRCVRRLARPGEIDKETILSCDKQTGRVLCDYCARGNRKCVDVGLFLVASLVRIADFSGSCLLPGKGQTPGGHLCQVLQETDGCESHGGPTPGQRP